MVESPKQGISELLNEMLSITRKRITEEDIEFEFKEFEREEEHFNKLKEEEK